MKRSYLGYLIAAVYIALYIVVYVINSVEPVIFGMPYVLWSAVLYGIMATPVLYLVYHFCWPELSEEDDQAE